MSPPIGGLFDRGGYTKRMILTPKAIAFAAQHLGCSDSDVKVHEVSGGYSRNRRGIVEYGGVFLFAKEVDSKLLPGNGDEEREWLRKDAGLIELLTKEGVEITPAWHAISEDSETFLTTAYRQEDGWLWEVPEEEEVQKSYIEAVIAATKNLERTILHKDDIERYKLHPFFRDELASDDGLDYIQSEEILHKLRLKFESLEQECTNKRVKNTLADLRIELGSKEIIDAIRNGQESLGRQTQEVLGHCDVRPDNLAYHPIHNKVVLVDWNWASLNPINFGPTEFLIDVSSDGHDTNAHYKYLNRDILAASVGYWLKRCLKPPLAPGNTLRDRQALSAATAYRLFRDSE